MLLRKYRKHQDGHGNNENYEQSCCILLSTATNSNQKPRPTSFEKTASKPSLDCGWNSAHALHDTSSMPFMFLRSTQDLHLVHSTMYASCAQSCFLQDIQDFLYVLSFILLHDWISLMYCLVRKSTMDPVGIHHFL